MRIPKRIVFLEALLLGAFAGSACAQQESTQPTSPIVQKTPYEALSPPSTFRVTEGDLELALAVSRQLAAGHHDQVQKMLADSHVSVPQFERTLQAACFLSAERRMAEAAQKPGERAAGTHPVNIQNLQDVQKQLKAWIDRLFGGRGPNYQESKAVADRQQAVADEICSLLGKKTTGAK